MSEGSPPGLSGAEAAARLAQEGHNDLPLDAARPWWRLVGGVLAEPMFALLLAAAVVYALVGDVPGALVLGLFAAGSIAITVVQEGRSQRVLDALRDLTSPRALVLRDGNALRIPGREVVRGDLLLLSEGDRVAADGQVLAGTGLQVDESLLTGESLPVSKRSGEGGRDGCVYSGTLVVRGHARVRVIATGRSSQIGRIGLALRETPLAPVRLQAQTQQVVRVMGAVGLMVSLAVVVVQGVMRHAWLQGLLGGIAVGMSMLPEEFPLVLTVFTVMGAWRLSASRVLTRRAAAIETLGAATVLCTDKTGTLTRNRLSVTALWADSQRWSAEEGTSALASRDALRALLTAAQAASDESAFDPLDQALLALPREACLATPLQEFAFTPALAATGRVWAADGGGLLAVKGAPEALLALCEVPQAQRQRVRDALEAYAASGSRVLGVARALIAPGGAPPALPGTPLVWLGLVAFADPLRDTVPAAVRDCDRAGLRVVMITGDHPQTACAIARQAGIADTRVLTGAQIDALGDPALQAAARGTAIFARIAPTQKLRIVQALRGDGEVVAMTGDGVNDAPALRAADIGIAMGGRGSDVAREAAALVLLDDDFTSIVTAVRIGRRIYDNLRKAMVYILAVHVPIAGLALLPLLFGGQMLLTPMLVAMLELIIDPACSVVLEAEVEDTGLMARPPRDPREKIFGAPQVLWALAQGLLALLILGAALGWSHGVAGVGETGLRTVALLVLIGENLVLIHVNRGPAGRAARVNRSYWLTVVLASAVTAAVLALAPLRAFVHVAPPTARDLLLALASWGLLLGVLRGLQRLRPPSASR